MHRGTTHALLIAAITSFAIPPAHATAESAATNPFAAHNAYTWRLYGNKRLTRALDAGLKHVEVDIAYDSARGVMVVTHDNPPRGGEPELGEFLEPLWRKWQDAPDVGYTLILDFKSSQPEAARYVGELLEKHRNMLSSLPKSPGGVMHQKPITVCLTGSNAAHKAYADWVPADGEYLAFGDVGHEGWQEDASDYVPAEPAGFVRFVTLERRALCDSARPTGDALLDPHRVATVARLAEERGYQARVYTINPARQAGKDYDTRNWQIAVDAGIQMIATDAYELARDWWADRPKASP